MHFGFAVFIVIAIGGEDVDKTFFGKAERAQMARNLIIWLKYPYVSVIMES